MPANFPGPPEPAIHRAARLGDLAHLKELVTSGVDINLAVDLAFDYGSYLQKLTPLMVAAASTEGASLSTVRWLVDNGAAYLPNPKRDAPQHGTRQVDWKRIIFNQTTSRVTMTNVYSSFLTRGLT